MQARIVVEHGTPAYWLVALHTLACRAGLVHEAARPLRLPSSPRSGSDPLSAAMRLFVRVDGVLRDRAVRRGVRSPDLVTHGVACPVTVAVPVPDSGAVPGSSGGGPSTPPSSVAELLDGAAMVLYLGASTPPDWLVASVPFGVLQATDGGSGLGGGERPAHLEALVNATPTVAIDVWHHKAGAPAARVFASRTQTRGVSPAVHDELCALRAADLLTLVAARMSSSDGVWRQPVVPSDGGQSPPPRSSSASNAAVGAGSSATGRHLTAGSALRLLARRVGATVRSQRAQSFWGLGYRRTQHESVRDAVRRLHEVEPVLPPPGASWADPFPVRVDGRDLVFFEEELPGGPYAHISMAELLPDGRFTPAQRVLTGPGHLSYPGVFRHDGEWFMVPESATSCVVSLYRATDFPLRWEKECDLITDTQIVDPTVLQHEGRWWLLGGRVGADKAPFEDLVGYSAPSLTGPWSPHPLNPLVSDACSGRPAGHVFLENGELVRPAQDCSLIYGHGLSLQRVTALSPDDYGEAVIVQRSADWSDELTGVHTFNRSETLTWVDLRWRQRRP